MAYDPGSSYDAIFYDNLKQALIDNLTLNINVSGNALKFEAYFDGELVANIDFSAMRFINYQSGGDIVVPFETGSFEISNGEIIITRAD